MATNVTEAVDQTIDTSKTYTFTNAFTGPGLVLAASNDSKPILSMVNLTTAGTGGQWFLTRVNGNQPGLFYRIHPASMGLGQSLDVINQGGAVEHAA